MCYVVPFTLPCCRRTYVSVTKMKDCPTDWPKTKCPKELCFQIGSQADDRDEGTCWRCKAAEAGIPQEHREGLRPGIDSADVERFILTPEDRRSQIEEDGFCWFCGHKCGCESCEPVRIEGVNESLLGRNRSLPVVEEIGPVNKRLKLERFGSSRPKSAASSSKSKFKARPQTRSTSKRTSKGSSYSHSPPPDGFHRQVSSPSEGSSNVHHQPKQEYTGYGDQSRFFSSATSNTYPMYTPFQTSAGDHVRQSHLDPRLFAQPPFSTPEPTHQLDEKPLMIDSRLVDSHAASVNTEQLPTQATGQEQLDSYSASPPRSQHIYQQSYGQAQALDPRSAANVQGGSSALSQGSQSYDLPQVLSPRNANGNYMHPDIPQAYGQPQGFGQASYGMNQGSPSFPGYSYGQNHHQQTMSYPYHNGPSQLSYGNFYAGSTSSTAQPPNPTIKQHGSQPPPTNDDVKLSDVLDDFNTDSNTNNRRERDGEYEYSNVTRS